MKPIILIDDDEDDQEMMSGICSAFRPEYPILQFFTATEALRHLQSATQQPLVIFCDLNMPVMTGVDLLRVIQSSPELRSKSIPFICLSTANNAQYIQQVYDMGVQGFFQKPSTLKEYQEIIELSLTFWEKCLHPRHPLVG